MSQYLYTTTIYTETDNVIGINVTQNNIDLTDYENNHQSDTVKVTELQIAETTFKSDLSYVDFDALIVAPYDWGDVKEVNGAGSYNLYLITSEPI